MSAFSSTNYLRNVNSPRKTLCSFLRLGIPKHVGSVVCIRNLTLATGLEQPHLPGGTSHPESMIHTNASFTTCYHKISTFILIRPTVNHRMAIHSSILAWRIPWTEEPGGLQSMGSQRVQHNWATNTTTTTTKYAFSTRGFRHGFYFFFKCLLYFFIFSIYFY